MIKRRLLITHVILISACYLAGCSTKNEASNQKQSTIEYETSVQSLSEQDIRQKEENDPMNISDLTQQSSQSVTIDYAIESNENIQNFSYSLLSQTLNDKNPVLSPLSAYLALSMVGCGADGATKDEFYEVLGADMMAISDDTMNRLPTKGDLLNISIANSVWIDDEFTVNDTWIGTIKSLMDAEAFQTDLSTAETMTHINRWIDTNTNGLIDKMLEKPLDSETRIALLNTVYFKGKWQFPFKFTDTYKETFYINRAQNTTEQVDMMNMYLKEIAYLSNDFTEGVILPYQNNNNENLAFIALKPTDESSIRDVYHKLTKTVINDLIGNKQTRRVNLKLPKFEITFDIELNESLKNMGLQDCFDEVKANFNQMGQTKTGYNLYISLVRQKAKIIVDEEGTEAAAATEIAMAEGCCLIVDEPYDIFFNEPFLYMIMDMDQNIPLFLGILDTPVQH